MNTFPSLPKSSRYLRKTLVKFDFLRCIIVTNKTSGAGSDYMSYTQLGYPAAFASEGNPAAGEYDSYIHTDKDTMNVDDETGIFSLEVSNLRMLLHSKLLMPP